MWARVVEFMLACWLALSPFIFRYPNQPIFLWVNDFICSCFIGFFALICYVKSMRKMHLGNIAISIWLFIAGYFFSIPKPASQNYITFSLLLFMLAIIPTEAEKPPIPWRDFYTKKSN